MAILAVTLVAMLVIFVQYSTEKLNVEQMLIASRKSSLK